MRGCERGTGDLTAGDLTFLGLEGSSHAVVGTSALPFDGFLEICGLIRSIRKTLINWEVSGEVSPIRVRGRRWENDNNKKNNN